MICVYLSFGKFQHSFYKFILQSLSSESHRSLISFFTTPSNIPSEPKLQWDSLGSTRPGSWKQREKRPDGQRFPVLLSTSFPPVAVSPSIKTLPLMSSFQLNAAASEKEVSEKFVSTSTSSYELKPTKRRMLKN